MFRIVERKEGFAVEKSKKGLFTSWIPYITYMGSDRVFYHKTYEGALDNLLLEIKKTVEYVDER